jgi:glycosyltransferase involved in cell wall biosynthesis
VKICLITTGQPSTDPRLVKEADAFSEAGHEVNVVAAHWSDWASDLDGVLLASRQWRMSLVDWRRHRAPFLFHRSRVRHWLARRAGERRIVGRSLDAAAVARVGPELRKRAIAIPADFYVAHNLGALPAAFSAAKRHSASCCFDAEDFHSGQLSTARDARAAAFTRAVERRYLPECAWVTAASPGIGEAYRDLCGIGLPTCILNVFPLRDRPVAFNPGDSNQPVRLYWFSQTIGANRGLEDVVRAVGLLNRHDVQVHLRGHWQQGYETVLRRLAAESGVAQNLIVSHEPAQPDDMARLASTCDIGLALEPIASINNDIAISNKIFTYVLAGTAVVASRTRGQSRLVADLGAAATWCEPGDPASLAAALRPWLEQRDALVAARETAWHLGETRFNWDLEKSKLLNVLKATQRRFALPGRSSPAFIAASSTWDRRR